MKQFIQSLKIFLALIIIPILLCGSTAFSKKQIWAAESKQAQLSAGKITEKSSEKNSEKKTILQIQARLTQLGYKPGQLDGIGGRKTENEIKKFQKNNILTITGKLDFETKSKLWPVSSDTTGIKNPKIAEDKDVTVNRFVVMPSHKKSIIFYVNLLLYGSLITFALYYFCLYWLRKKTLSTLYFGFFCLLADFFYLLSIEKPFLLTLTIIDSEFLTRIRLICLCFLITVFILLMNNLYPNDFSKKRLGLFKELIFFILF